MEDICGWLTYLYYMQSVNGIDCDDGRRYGKYGTMAWGGDMG